MKNLRKSAGYGTDELACGFYIRNPDIVIKHFVDTCIVVSKNEFIQSIYLKKGTRYNGLPTIVQMHVLYYRNFIRATRPLVSHTKHV